MTKNRSPLPLLLLFLAYAAMLTLIAFACQSSRALKSAAPNLSLRQAMLAANDESRAWKLAEKQGDFTAFRLFQTLHPFSEYTVRTEQRLAAFEEEYWREVLWAIETNAPIKGYLLDQYLDIYPNGKHLEAAWNALDTINPRDRWFLVYAEGGPAYHQERLRALAGYLNAFPNGVMARWIEEKIARNLVSQWYLERYPESHAATFSAADRIAMLRQLESAGLLAREQGKTVADYLAQLAQQHPTLNVSDQDLSGLIDQLDVPQAANPYYWEKASAVGTEDEREPFETFPPLTSETIRPVEERPLPAQPFPITRPRPAERPSASLRPRQYSPSLDDLAAEDVSTLRQRGVFEYDPIPTLTVRLPYVFNLRITPKPDSSEMESAKQVASERVRRDIDISSEMSVRIQPENPNAFEIIPLGETIQPIEPNSSTIWSWRITPLLAGRHKVVVSIDIVTKSELTGDLRRRTIKVYDEEIEVLAVENPLPPEPPQAGGGFHPLWLLGLLPLALGIFFFYARRRKQAAAPAVMAFGAGGPASDTEQIREKKRILQSINPEMAPLLVRAEELIAQGDTSQALQELRNFFNDRYDPIHDEVLGLTAQYNKYLREQNLGLNPDASIPNRVNFAIIELINRIRLLAG